MNRSERLMEQRKKAEARGMEQRRSLGDGRNFRTGPQPGIAGAFQGVNPAQAGYNLGNAGVMANQQQQPQTQANQQALNAQALNAQALNAQGGGMQQANQMQMLRANQAQPQQPQQPQQPFVPTGRSQQAKDFSVLENRAQNQLQQFGITDPQQANMLAQQMRIGQTQDPALRQQYAQGFQQQQIMDAQKAHQQRMQDLSGQLGFNYTPQSDAQLRQNAQGMQQQLLQQLGGQGGMGGMQQLGGQPQTQANLQQMQAQLYGQAQLANQFGNQGGMGLKPQGNTGTGFNLGSGPYGSVPSLAMPIINPQRTSVNLPGMGGQPLGAQPAGQQQMNNMFGGMQQQFGKAY